MWFAFVNEAIRLIAKVFQLIDQLWLMLLLVRAVGILMLRRHSIAIKELQLIKL